MIILNVSELLLIPFQYFQISNRNPSVVTMEAKSSSMQSDPRRIMLRTAEDFEVRTPERSIFNSFKVDVPWQNQFERLQMSVPGTREIRMKSSADFRFSLWNHKHWLANVSVSRDMIAINNNYRLHGNVAECVQVNDVVRDLSAGIRVVLLGTGVLHRVDLKLVGGTCFSLFAFGRDILTVRPNGQFLQDRLENAFNHVSTKTLEYERTQNDIKFIVSNQMDPTRLTKRVECKDSGTQTCQMIQLVTAETLQNAVDKAIETVTAKFAHPWISPSRSSDAGSTKMAATVANDGNEGAMSLAAKDFDAVSVASGMRDTRVEESRAAIRAREAWKENVKRFGGLFEHVSRNSDADDESE